MSKLLRHSLLILMSLCLAACLYRPVVQQGNIVTAAMLAQVKTGMTPAQVQYALGTPTLVNTLDPHCWIYLYNYKANHEPLVQQTVTLQFNHGLLQTITNTPLVALPASETA